MLGVYPSGIGSQAKSFDLNVTFGPDTPDYAGIAVAAGRAWGKQISKVDEVNQALTEAITIVLTEKRCAVLEILLEEL